MGCSTSSAVAKQVGKGENRDRKVLYTVPNRAREYPSCGRDSLIPRTVIVSKGAIISQEKEDLNKLPWTSTKSDESVEDDMAPFALPPSIGMMPEKKRNLERFLENVQDHPHLLHEVVYRARVGKYGGTNDAKDGDDCKKVVSEPTPATTTVPSGASLESVSSIQRSTPLHLSL
mmetsp:Transcript_35668/g.83469  ORF Transcript_35668/g.83469 Transcript_35668/m.83469 type:complete len:174 (+) Transcript_35668:62-583(+)